MRKIRFILILVLSLTLTGCTSKVVKKTKILILSLAQK